MKVLIADDNTLQRALLARLLKADDHEVIEASDGAEALELLTHAEVDVVISDPLMPRIDGFQFCAELRNDPRWRDLAFILHVSGVTTQADENRGRAVGISAILTRPTRAASLRAALSAVAPRLKRAGPPSASEAAHSGQRAGVANTLAPRNPWLSKHLRAVEPSEARLHLVLDAAGLGAWEWDPAGNRFCWSGSHPELFGEHARDFSGSYEDFEQCIHPDDREAVRGTLHIARSTRRASAHDFRAARSDGSVRWIRLRTFSATGQSATNSHVAGITEDITERRALDVQLRHAQRLEAIGALAGGIVHDLNNILTPALMAANMLRDRLTDPRDRELMRLVESSTLRGAGIVRQLLAFSRGIEGARTAVQVRHVVKEMASIVRETFPRGIRLSEHGEPGLWTVVANPTLIHQVLLNLCINARDAMPDGGDLTIEAKNVSYSEPQTGVGGIAPAGQYVQLTIRDTGHGIPSEITDRIFEPFFSTKEAKQGTGLGLSMVLGIVQSHGGFVTVESSGAKGSTFRVHLPAMLEPVAASSASGPENAAPGNGETILVVDDESSILTAARHCLERNGYQVLTAVDGQRALTTLLNHRHEVKVVVTDVMMSGMNGFAFAQVLCALYPQMRVIAATGMSGEMHQASLAEYGVADFLRKPYGPHELLAAMRRALAPRTVSARG